MDYESKFQEIEQLYQEMGEVEKSLFLLQKIKKQAEKEENMEILVKVWQRFFLIISSYFCNIRVFRVAFLSSNFKILKNSNFYYFIGCLS